MAKEFWFNLPVSNLEKSKQFFKKIGFIENPNHSSKNNFESFFIGDKKVVMMLFPVDTFKQFVANKVSDTNKGAEVLFNIDAQSKAEVDMMAITVENAGGTVYAAPFEKDGWMYGLGFSDLDGHCWNMLYMDLNKIQQ